MSSVPKFNLYTLLWKDGKPKEVEKAIEKLDKENRIYWFSEIASYYGLEDDEDNFQRLSKKITEPKYQEYALAYRVAGFIKNHKFVEAEESLKKISGQEDKDFAVLFGIDSLGYKHYFALKEILQENVSKDGQTRAFQHLALKFSRREEIRNDAIDSIINKEIREKVRQACQEYLGEIVDSEKKE